MAIFICILSILYLRTILPTPNTFQTDAFAMGIILIELLISGAMATEDPATFPLEAREKVNSEDLSELSAVVQALAAKGGWESSGAQRAAKILADVAVSCTRGTSKRQTPAKVMSQLETARDLAEGKGGGGVASWAGW
jgi:hypothetical protein